MPVRRSKTLAQDKRRHDGNVVPDVILYKFELPSVTEEEEEEKTVLDNPVVCEFSFSLAYPVVYRWMF